jgi:mono/diheme cytochrome c family protein
MSKLLMAGLILCAGSLSAGAADDDPNKAAYLRYCGACHGPGGKGDGVESSFLRPPPTDRTQIAKKKGGDFPVLRVMQIIDGRATVRAHGDPEMPVWGEIFAQQASRPETKRAEVQGKIMAITEHIRSIQQK